MRKIAILFLVLLLLVSGYCAADPTPQAGWNYDSGNAYYLNSDGIPVTGWQTIDGCSYYFRPDQGGAMVSGWLELPQGRYYFDSSGVLQTGWLQLSGQRYYFDNTGVLQTGWLQMSGQRYYFDNAGILQTGWQQISGNWYYFRPDGAMAVGTLEIDGVPHHFTSTGEPVLLVNRSNPLPIGFQPELADIEGFQVSKACVDSLQDMINACRSAGHRCVINSAYRDTDFQQMLWDNRYNSYISQGYSPEAATELSAQIVLPPGTSEHHTGLAVDITGTEQMYSWLEQHAPEYGFILRYPQDKTQWTGVSYEPWHFRYVGRELALELQALNLTLEEYLHRLTES